MKLDEKIAEKNLAKKMQISKNTHAWVLPKQNGFYKMVAYYRGKTPIWVHPEYALQEKKQKSSKG